MPSNSESVIECVISVDADAGLLAAARAQSQREGARSQIAGQMTRVRSAGTIARVGQVGARRRLSRAVLYAGAERDLCVSALRAATATRPRPTSPQPPRVLPTAPKTGTTRLS
jgi:hypothetical protein